MKKCWVDALKPTERKPKETFKYFRCPVHNQRVNYQMCMARAIVLKEGLADYEQTCKRCTEHGNADHK